MKRWITASFAVAATAAACYVSPSGSSSSQQQSSSSSSCGGAAASCPPTPPSYATDVSPIVFQYCESCHAPGKSQSGKPLDTYASVTSLSAKVQSKVNDCSMPPSGSPQPTAAERDTLLGWLACGAPNN